MILEACVGNLKEAIKAEKLGANQIELCDRLDLDGISPSISNVELVCNSLKIPVKVIVNPNPYNYSYSRKDLKVILAFINQLNNYPLQGIVFGPLTKEKLPDLETIKLVSEHTDFPITFHKAIDISKDITKSTAMLIDQDIVKFILSSGGTESAQEGISQLLNLKYQLEKSFIQLIGAGKITAHNLSGIHEKLNLTHYHGKKIVGNLNLSS